MNTESIKIFLKQMDQGKIIYKNGQLYRLFSRDKWLTTPKPIGFTDKDGYIRVSISENGKKHQSKVHRIIYAYFHGIDSIDGLTINHIDGVKDNNKIENLEAVTHQENMIHATRLGLNKVFGMDCRKLA